MKADIKSIRELFEFGLFEPAKVQREYQWGDKEVKQLFDDLVTAFRRFGDDPGEDADDTLADGDEQVEDAEQTEAQRATGEMQVASDGECEAAENTEPITVARVTEQPRQKPDMYFLGSVILLKPPRATRYFVYDGLQRLTTLTLLLVALRSVWTDCSQEDRHQIDTMLFVETEQKRVRRLAFSTSGSTLASAVNGETLANRDLTPGDRRMRDALETLRSRLTSGWDDRRRSAFLHFISELVKVAAIEQGNHAVAYQMFVAANTRGLNLSIGDVLKGLLGDLVRRNGGSEAQIDRCARRWRRGQISLRGEFDDFVHAMEVYTEPPACIQEEGGRRKWLTRHTTGEKLLGWFGDETPPQDICKWIEEDFTSMLAVFEAARRHNGTDQLERIELSFRRLSFLEWKDWQPLLVAIGLKYLRLDDARFASEVAELMRASYIIELLDISAPRRLEWFCKAIEQRENGLNPFTGNGRGRPSGILRFQAGKPLANGARRKLRGAFPAATRRGALVRFVETLHWNDRVPSRSLDGTTVEHVLPIRAVGTTWDRAFTDPEREHWTHRLGNLCLIDEAGNDTAANNWWDAKEAVYSSRRASYRGVDRVLVTSDETVALGERWPWSPKAVELLTERLSVQAEQSLGLV